MEIDFASCCNVDNNDHQTRSISECYSARVRFIENSFFNLGENLVTQSYDDGLSNCFFATASMIPLHVKIKPRKNELYMVMFALYRVFG